MKEIYHLNQNMLPMLPTVHDSIINRITLQGQMITFYLNADVNDKDDAIKFFHPEAKALIIRYHQTEEDSFSIYKMKRSPRHLYKLFPPHYTLLNDNVLEKLASGKYRLEYLYQYVGYNSIIIKLFEEDEIILDASVDYVEYEWIS